MGQESRKYDQTHLQEQEFENILGKQERLGLGGQKHFEEAWAKMRA